MGETANVGRDTFQSRRAKRCRAVPGGAKPFAGWGGLEGFTPPHRFKARTAASDGHCAFTRAARSAGLRFAVILLSKTMDVGRDHLIHRKRSPFPYEGKDLTPLKLGRGCECRAHRAVNSLQNPAPGLAPHPPLTRSPFPSRGRTIAHSKVGETANVGRCVHEINAESAKIS